MIRIKREMQKTETIKSEYPETQVAFNSDGCITIRKYDSSNKDKDEIIILSQNETAGIISFLSHFARLCKTYELPF